MSIGSKTTNGSVLVALSLVLTKGVFVFSFLQKGCLCSTFGKKRIIFIQNIILTIYKGIIFHEKDDINIDNFN